MHVMHQVANAAGSGLSASAGPSSVGSGESVLPSTTCGTAWNASSWARTAGSVASSLLSSDGGTPVSCGAKSVILGDAEVSTDASLLCRTIAATAVRLLCEAASAPMLSTHVGESRATLAGPYLFWGGGLHT